MQSYQISLTPHERDAGRHLSTVRREIQKALAEENSERGTTQASIAATLGVNRSVIHRQIMGLENLTVGRVGEIASVLGRQIIFALVKPEAQGNHSLPGFFPGQSQSAVSGAVNGFLSGGNVPQNALR